MIKITKRQLHRLILSEITQDLNISDAELEAAREKLEDEGGAAAADQVIDALKSADNTDAEDEASISDEDILDALMKKDDAIVQHEKGDLVYKRGLNERIDALPKGQFRISQMLGSGSGPLGFLGSGPEPEPSI